MLIKIILIIMIVAVICLGYEDAYSNGKLDAYAEIEKELKQLHKDLEALLNDRS